MRHSSVSLFNNWLGRGEQWETVFEGDDIYSLCYRTEWSSVDIHLLLRTSDTAHFKQSESFDVHRSVHCDDFRGPILFLLCKGSACRAEWEYWRRCEADDVRWEQKNSPLNIRELFDQIKSRAMNGRRRKIEIAEKHRLVVRSLSCLNSHTDRPETEVSTRSIQWMDTGIFGTRV